MKTFEKVVDLILPIKSISQKKRLFRMTEETEIEEILQNKKTIKIFHQFCQEER